MEQSRGNSHRQNVMFGLTGELCASLVSGRLRARYGDLRHVTKLNARRFGCSARAFENWLYGKNAPRMQDLILLMADVPELHAEVNDLVARTREALCPSSSPSAGAASAMTARPSASCASDASASP